MTQTKQTIFHAATRGARYEIKAYRHGDGTLSYEEFTRGGSSLRSLGHTPESLRRKIRSAMHDARAFDGINYRVITALD